MSCAAAFAEKTPEKQTTHLHISQVLCIFHTLAQLWDQPACSVNASLTARRTDHFALNSNILNEAVILEASSQPAPSDPFYMLLRLPWNNTKTSALIPLHEILCRKN